MIDANTIPASRILIANDQQANFQVLERMPRRGGYPCGSSTTDPIAVVGSEIEGGNVFWVDLASISVRHIDIPDSIAGIVGRFDTGAADLGQTVLYVEDNPANLKLVEMLVARRAGLCLLSADTGDLGIEMALAHQPDVILMDINLPGTNGIDALTFLHRDAGTAHIPIIALSVNTSARDIERGMAAGFLRYLTKPIKVDEFMDALDLGLDIAAATKADLAGEA